MHSKLIWQKYHSGLFFPSATSHCFWTHLLFKKQPSFHTCLYVTVQTIICRHFSRLLEICDPPYKNMSYPQKHFLGGLRSLWNPFKTRFLRVWNSLETLLKLFGNTSETLWKPFWNALKPFGNALKPFWNGLKLFGNPLKCLGTWEHSGNPLEMSRILFEKLLLKCRGKKYSCSFVFTVHMPVNAWKHCMQ